MRELVHHANNNLIALHQMLISLYEIGFSNNHSNNYSNEILLTELYMLFESKDYKLRLSRDHIM
jgi:hypothetical protein